MGAPLQELRAPRATAGLQVSAPYLILICRATAFDAIRVIVCMRIAPVHACCRPPRIRDDAFLSLTALAPEPSDDDDDNSLIQLAIALTGLARNACQLSVYFSTQEMYQV